MSTRKFSRVPFQVDASARIADHRFRGTVDNLSMSGMFMLTGEQLQMGDVADITIMLSGTSPEIHVHLTGRVSRIVENGIGFTFEKTDLESYTHLKNIIAYNCDDADKVMEEIHHAIDKKIATEK